MTTQYSRKDAEEAGKTALLSGNTDGLFSLGLHRIAHILRDKPIRFEKYLELTGEHLDEVAAKAEKQTGERYCGGELFFRLSDTEYDTVFLEAKLYFLVSAEKELYSVQTLHGTVEKCRFDEWDSCPELMDLAEKKEIRFALDPS